MNVTFAVLSSDAIFLAGLFLVVWFAWRWSRNRGGGKRDHDRFAKDATTGMPSNRPQIPPASLGPWEVGMHDLARDLSAQLDTKIRIVQQLVLRAEQQSARLEAAINRAERLLEADTIERARGSASPLQERPDKEVVTDLKRQATISAEMAELNAVKKAVG